MALRARPGPTRRGGPSSLAQQQQRPVRPSSAVAASQRLRRLAARAVAASDGSGGNGNGRAPSSGGAATAAPPLPVHAPILDASFWRDSPPLAPPRPPPRATQQWPLPAHEPPPPDVPRTEAAELSLVAEQFWRQGGGFPRYLQATTARSRARRARASQWRGAAGVVPPRHPPPPLAPSHPRPRPQVECEPCFTFESTRRARARADTSALPPNTPLAL